MNAAAASKQIMITGASSGIGKACAQYLDKKGFAVFAGVRSEADGEALQEGASNRLTPVKIDVCDNDSIARAFDWVERSVAPAGLDGLVNNAGTALASPVEYLDLARFQHLLNVNLIGMIAVTQTFLPLLRRQKGRIINMGSISGRASLPFLGPYSASKFALEAITDALRIELRPWGIGVSIVAPGNVETQIRKKALNSFENDAQRFPPSADALYGPVFDALRNHSRRKAMNPVLVAQTVERALTARRPKPRYVLGRDARILSLIQKLPVRLRDMIIAAKLPEYGHSPPLE